MPDPSQLAAEVQSDRDSPVTPLGTVQVGQNGSSYTLTIPKETAEGVGIEVGQEIQVAYEPASNLFCYQPADEFDGW